jgi:enoyl-CoA hydratase/carnithine racemase
LARTTLTRVGATAVVALASDKVNALDVEVLGELATIVEYCEQEPGISALVLTGEGSIFSAGLNVSEILAHDTSYTATLLDSLSEALVRIFACPLPTVAAINGPAIAGGCILACACDQRLMAQGARIGVTELRVGVSFPVAAFELVRQACGRDAESLIFDAKLLDADEACRRGLVHQVLAPSELQSTAIALAEELASLDSRAYALAKAWSRREALRSIGGEDGRLFDEQVLSHWQDDQTRASLEQLLKPRG